MDIRTIDLSPLYRASVGFDRLFQTLDSVSQESALSYPPYNIEKVSEDAYRIVMAVRSEEHTSELQSLMRISYAVFCLKKKIFTHIDQSPPSNHLHYHLYNASSITTPTITHTPYIHIYEL